MNTLFIKKVIPQIKITQKIVFFLIILLSLNLSAQKAKNIKWNCIKTQQLTKDILIVINNKISDATTFRSLIAKSIKTIKILDCLDGSALYGSQGSSGVIVITLRKKKRKLNTKKLQRQIYLVDGKKVNHEHYLKLNLKDVKSIRIKKSKASIDLYGKNAKQGIFDIKLHHRKKATLTNIKPEKESHTVSLKGEVSRLNVKQTNKGISSKTTIHSYCGIRKPSDYYSAIILLDSIPISKETFNKIDAKSIQKITVIKASKALEKYGKISSDGIIQIISLPTKQNAFKKILENQVYIVDEILLSLDAFKKLNLLDFKSYKLITKSTLSKSFFCKKRATSILIFNTY